MNCNETVIFGRGLKWSNFARYEDRVSSYETWPRQMNQDKHVLAQAGFIYMKEGDIVECFACGVRLSQWTANDVPLLEHQKWSPDCIYIKLVGSTGTDTRSAEYGFDCL